MLITVDSHIREGKKDFAIILEGYTELEDLQAVQEALIYAIKTIANDDDTCGENKDLWEIANLLEMTFNNPD